MTLIYRYIYIMTSDILLICMNLLKMPILHWVLIHKTSYCSWVNESAKHIFYFTLLSSSFFLSKVLLHISGPGRTSRPACSKTYLCQNNAYAHRHAEGNVYILVAEVTTFDLLSWALALATVDILIMSVIHLNENIHQVFSTLDSSYTGARI